MPKPKITIDARFFACHADGWVELTHDYVEALLDEQIELGDYGFVVSELAFYGTVPG
jgi:hypothetical protein